MTSRLFLLAVLWLVLPVTWMGAPAAAEPDVLVESFALGGSGVRVFHAENPAGFGLVQFRVSATTTGDYQPWHMEWILPNGTIMPFVQTYASETYDGSNWGYGDGVVYAGAADSTLASPAVVAYDTPLVWDWYTRLVGTEGWLVLAWANHSHPIELEVALPPGTTVSFVASSNDVASYEAKDFGGGVRAGVPAAAIVTLGDGLEFEPRGGQLWGYVVYLKSTALGRGALSLARAGDGFVREESFNATIQFTPGVGTCICWDWGRWLFTSISDINVDFDYVGDGGRTALYVVVARLPAGTLPDDLWTEFSGHPAPPPGG